MAYKILVVDDEPNILRIASYAIQAEGFEVSTAVDGRSALASIANNPPDLVLLDVMLPDMTGLQITARLRADPKTAALPIIALSARARVADKVTGLEAGVDDYVTKPFDMDELVARIRALLERTKRLSGSNSASAGKVLGVVGARGGVGATTVALNLAAALCMQGVKAIAAEMTPFPGAFHAQISENPTQDISNLLGDGTPFITEDAVRGALVARPTGLQLLYAARKLEGDISYAPERIEILIGALARLAQYVILDIPFIHSPMGEAAVRQCSFIAMVVEPVTSCTAIAAKQLELLRSWGMGGTAVGLVVVNRAPLTNSLKPAQVVKQLNTQMLGVVPFSGDQLGRAAEMGKTVLVAQPDTLIASCMKDLAARLSSSPISFASF